jgi:hypothetical protein
MRGREKTYMEDLSFPPLDGTETERAKLTRIFVDWRTETISLGGKDATKEALFRTHSPYILHLATHGFFASEDNSDTRATELQPVSLQASVFKSKFFNNPMHRSGLALAGAQATLKAWEKGEATLVENDGIVTAEDVSTLDLQGTWLVTLSFWIFARQWHPQSGCSSINLLAERFRILSASEGILNARKLGCSR